MPSPHYLVIDFEATCTDSNEFPRDEMEIVEIGAVLASGDTFQVVSEFQSFVRPVRNPQLTDFCRELTGITQERVDSAPGFLDVLTRFNGWLAEQGEAVFCSWGDYDRHQLTRDCAYHNVEYPFGVEHINLKKRFAQSQSRRPQGLSAALRSVNLPFVGSPHRGIDDARNIASLLPFTFPAKR